MNEGKKEGALDLHQTLADFRRLVPWSQCRQILGWNASHLATPAALTCGIALLDAAGLLLLIPILSLLSGTRDVLQGVPGLAGFPHKELIVGLALLLCLTGLSKARLAYTLHAWNGRFYEHGSERLSNFLFHRYLQFGRAYFLETSQSKLWELLDKRHDLLSLFLAVQRLVLNSTLLVTHLLILFFISWPLAVVLGVLVPIFYLLLRVAAGRHALREAQTSGRVAALYPKAYRVFATMDLHRNYCQEEQAEAEFARSNAEIRQASLAHWMLRGSVERSREVLSLLCLVLLLLITSRLVTEKPDLLMSYLVFFFIVKNSLPLMGTYQEVALEFRNKLPAAREFLELFSDAGKHRIAEGKEEFTPPVEGYTLDGLSFCYPNGVEVFRDLSCQIPAGKTTALVGPSGAGKSSLLQLLVRSFEFEGTLTVDGTSIRDFSLRSIRSKTAFIGQSPVLLRDSLRENLNFGLSQKKSDQELRETLSEVGLEHWLDKLPEGLDTLIGDDGSTVSAGQRQRLALARDLVRSTAVYLIDEPTSALDKVNELEVQKLIHRTTRGKTTVLVTHNLEFLTEVDQILVLQDGQIVQQGTYRELSSREGLFKTLSKARICE